MEINYHAVVLDRDGLSRLVIMSQMKIGHVNRSTCGRVV